jgi:hypothetical protein
MVKWELVDITLTQETSKKEWEWDERNLEVEDFAEAFQQW